MQAFLAWYGLDPHDLVTVEDPNDTGAPRAPSGGGGWSHPILTQLLPDRGPSLGAFACLSCCGDFLEPTPSPLLLD